MDKAELTAREKNEGRVRLLRLLQLLETDSDAEHPISTPECIRLLKERWDIDAFRITIGRDMEALAMAGYDVRTIHSHDDGAAESCLRGAGTGGQDHSRSG